MVSPKSLEIDERIFFLGFLFLAVFLHARIFYQPVIDWDEYVYLYLSDHMNWSLANYTTQGSFLDKVLPAKVYSAELFFHPPLIPYLIKLMAAVMPQLLAAKLLNLILVLLSFYFIFNISRTLCGFRGAAIALSLWAICPIVNLESKLVHLDFPMTVFLLGGIWFFIDYQEWGFNPYKILLSGVAFVLAMWSKYSGPIYILIPFILACSDPGLIRRQSHILLYGAIVSLGFSWWVYVLVRYGSFTPADFIGAEGQLFPIDSLSGEGENNTFKSPYLEAIVQRKWFHLWFYFLCICPLFALYLGGVARFCFKTKQFIREFTVVPQSDRTLVALNFAIIIVVMILTIVISRWDSIWTMRLFMPFYPVVYITLGKITTTLLEKERRIMNANLTVVFFLTLVEMSFSTFNSVMVAGNLRVIPAVFMWIPGLEELYH